ncbi:MAG TPA: hypothetical protein PL155_08530 [Candidatus Omnitrophota bacterium]|nr:hypothetical protein [Candidatus Omnitrophota bacterium]HPD85500.1 hypothetical protein [Candidatus Omnitrophota bacterium]HRZ03999.1 hypothetical protein [Candidatus Omnitrophota bacterium]
MIDSVDSILKEIENTSLVEHRHPNIELKSSWDVDYGRKVCGLANKIGFSNAWLVIGMKDDGILVGNNEAWAKNCEQVVSQHANQFLNPIQAIKQISCHQINQSWIVVIHVQPPGAVTYWQGIPYKASGTTFAAMIPEEIMQLTVSLPGLEDFSAQEWKGRCEASLVAGFAETVSTKRSEAQFVDLSKRTADDVLTRLAIVDKNVVRILFGDFKFRIVYYNDSNEPVENSSQQGLIRLLSSEFMQSIQRWGLKNIQTESGAEITLESYPSKALREALANTVAHCAYFERQGEVVVEVYPAKLSISNLCLPESAHFANKWFSRSRNTVNRLLMETLRLGGYVDELGRGKNLIFCESIKAGLKPPIVEIEKAGQYSRWRLQLFGASRDPIQLKLLQRIKDLYKDEYKAMVAYALVLWSNLPVSRISQFIDGESRAYFEEILQDIDGPVFFYQKEDKLILHRWVRVLMEEGKDAKSFTLAEEEGLRNFAYEMCTKYEHGYITPKELRRLAHLGESNSEQQLSSELLSKWRKEGHVEFLRRGKYRFKEPVKPPEAWSALLDRLLKDSTSSALGNTANE